AVGFIGLERTRLGLTARISVSGAFVSAAGDPMQPSSWTVVEMGRSDGETLPLNAQESLQLAADGSAVFISRRGYVYSAPPARPPRGVRTKTCSPTGAPPIPDGFEEMHASDPTLCDSDVTPGIQPVVTQTLFVSQDLATAIHPSGGVNQAGTAAPGVC